MLSIDHTQALSSKKFDTLSIPDASPVIKEGHIDILDDGLKYDDYIDFYDEEDQEDDEDEYPTVFYNLKTASNTDLSHRNESLKERQQKIQQKKQEKQDQEQRIRQSPQNFEVTDEPEGHRVFLKKAKKLVPYPTSVKEYCYVPGQNLIFIILNDSMRVVIYSSLSFKLVKYIKFAKPIRVVRYLKDYDKVIFGGEDFFVQTFNLCTFKAGLQADLTQNAHVDEIAYLKKNNAIGVSTCQNHLYILSKSLVNLYKFELSCIGQIKDIISLTSDLVLASTQHGDRKSLHLCKSVYKSASHCEGISVRGSSCLEVAKKGTLITITCVASLSEQIIADRLENRLVELELDSSDSTSKLIAHKIGPEREFIKFEKIQNSDYFVATLRNRTALKLLLMRRSGDKFELLKSIIASDCPDLSKLIWLDQPSFVIGKDRQGSLCVYNVFRKDKVKRLKE